MVRGQMTSDSVLEWYDDKWQHKNLTLGGGLVPLREGVAPKAHMHT